MTLINPFLHQDIAAIIFEFLEPTKMLHLLLCSKQLHHLISTVSPVHHFVTILQCMEKKQPVPELVLPNHFVLQQFIVKQLWYEDRFCDLDVFLGNEKSRSHVVEVITRFLLQHDFCLQVMEWFPFDQVFLFHLSTTPPFQSSSNTMKRLEIWKKLRETLSQSALMMGEGCYLEIMSIIEYFVITEQWISTTGWETLLTKEGKVVNSLELKNPIIWLKDESLLDKILETNPNLALYLNADNVLSTIEIMEKGEQWKRLLQESPQKKLLTMKVFLRVGSTDLLRQLVTEFGLDTTTDMEWIIEAVKSNDAVFEYLPDKWKQNRRVIRHLSPKAKLKYLPQFDEQVKFDKCFILDLARKAKDPKEAVSESIMDIPLFHDVVDYFYKQNDIGFIESMINTICESQRISHTSVLQILPESISTALNKKQWDVVNESHVQFVLQELKKRHIRYNSLPDDFKSRIDVKRIAIENNELYNIADIVKDDPTVMQSVLEHGLGGFMVQCTDWELLLRFLKKDRFNFEYISDSIKDNPEFAMRAMKQGSNVFGHAESLHNNRDLALEAVKFDGTDLGFTSKELRDDIELVREAVKQNILATNCIFEEMKNDREIMMQLLEVNGGVLEYVWTKFYAQSNDDTEYVSDKDSYLKNNLLVMQELLSIALKGNVASVGKLPEKWLKYTDLIMNDNIVRMYYDFYGIEFDAEEIRTTKKQKI